MASRRSCRRSPGSDGSCAPPASASGRARCSPSVKGSLTSIRPTCATSTGRVARASSRTDDDLAAYDDAFGRYFLGEAAPRLVAQRDGAPAVDSSDARPLDAPAPVAGGERRPSAEDVGQAASEAELLRAKDFAECDPDELAAIGRLMTGLVVGTPTRKTRRTERARKGARPDLRRALRTHVRHGGAVVHIPRRRPRVQPRPLVLLLDVSGSMSSYSRALLQFAYAVARGPGRVEVFCFGTRLTRVSGALARRDPDEALRRAAETVVDWQGGTRIGESIREYLRTWAWRGGYRGGAVVICSDGLERGDPEVLAAAMARLARLAYRVFWVNPLKTGPTYEPTTRGMRAVLAAHRPARVGAQPDQPHQPGRRARSLGLTVTPVVRGRASPARA